MINRGKSLCVTGLGRKRKQRLLKGSVEAINSYRRCLQETWRISLR